MNPEVRGMLIDAVIKVSAVLLLATALAFAMPGAAASRRHAVWLIGLIAALLMPALCTLLPAWRVLPAWNGRVQASTSQPQETAADLPARNAVAMVLPEHRRDVQAQAGGVFRASQSPPEVPRAGSQYRKSFAIRAVGINRGVLLLSIWSVGSVCLLARLVLSAMALLKLRRRGTSCEYLNSLFSEIRSDLRIQRRVALRISDEQAMPMTWGVVNPVVLLPAEAQDWSRQRIRMAMLHELAHVKRWDALAQLIGQVACALYWFHPLVWLGARGLWREQERAADDQVLRTETAATDYATLLLELAAGGRWAEQPSAIAMARHAGLETRLTSILDTKCQRSPLSRWSILASLALGAAVVLPIAALHGQTPAGNPATKPATGTAQQYIGRVVTPDGQPVAGAEVARGLWGRDGTPQPPAVQTAADGSFVLPAAGDDPKYAESLIARAPGWPATAVSSTIGKDVTIHLTAASSVRVILLGPNDRPIVGLRVKPDRAIFLGLPPGLAFGEHRLLQYPQRWADDLARQTDSQGACVFDLPQLCNTSFRIEDERYAQPPHTQNLVQTGAEPHSADVTLHLELGGAIAGKVTYAGSGKPAAGVRVHVASSDRRNPQMYGMAFTDERGEYRIAQLSEGDYFLRPYFAQGAEWTAATVTHLHVTPGTTRADANLVLIKGAIVRGRVYEADTGKPFANASVMDKDMVSQTYCGTKTDADGRYMLRIPPGWQGVYFAQQPPDGYLVEGSDASSIHSMNVVDGQEVAFDIPLTPKSGKTVSGRVLDAQDKPVAGVSVNAVSPEDGSAEMNGRFVTSDASGHFEFRGVNAFMRLRVVDGDGGTLQPTDVNGGENDIVLRVVPHARTKITGTVVGTDGKPIPGAAITLAYRWGTYGMGGGPSAITDAEGRFSLPPLSPGPEYSIRIVARDYIERTVNLDFKPGAPKYDVPIRLQPAAYGPLN